MEKKIFLFNIYIFFKEKYTGEMLELEIFEVVEVFLTKYFKLSKEKKKQIFQNFFGQEESGVGLGIAFGPGHQNPTQNTGCGGNRRTKP